MSGIRLGVNIDHVATVRQARGERYPDPVQAAVMAELGGADNITAHLREDRRHIQDRDVRLLKETLTVPLNFEMAPTPEMIKIAAALKPHSVTLVPEKRQERTTEGGLDVEAHMNTLSEAIARLAGEGILVSLFVEPDRKAVELSRKAGAGAVEFHTGGFCRTIEAATSTVAKSSLVKGLRDVATEARQAGLQAHFGHGLNYTNAGWLQHVEAAEEANIGHAIVARALFVGMKEAVATMRALLNDPALKPRWD